MNLTLLILIGSLVANTVFTSQPSIHRRLAAQPNPGSPAQAIPLNQFAARFDEALEQLSETPDAATLDTALAAIQSAWNDFAAAERSMEQMLAARQQTFTAGEPQAELQSQSNRELAQRMSALEAQYQALLSAPRDLNTLRTAAQNVRDALSGAESSQPASQLDLSKLPLRPIPDFERPTPTLAAEQSKTIASPVAGEPPTPDDLASTEDARITPEIIALAQQLGNDPVAIYNYVRNQIGFDPYYGSRKGSLLTLWQRSGNDLDTASLLVALLRASGYPARYVRGFAEFDGAAARNWVGNAPDMNTAKEIFSRSGVSVTLPANGNLIKEHAWVAVYSERQALGYGAFLPLVNNGLAPTVIRPTTAAPIERTADANGQWVALDASFKQFTYQEPMDLTAVTGFSATQIIAQARANAIISDSAKSMSSLPEIPSSDLPQRDDADLELAEVAAQDAVSRTSAYIAAHPEMTSGDLMGGAFIISQTIASLTTTLPFAPVAGQPTTEYSTLPATLRDRVTIRVDTLSNTPVVSYTASFPALANQRVTVSYVAATANDQAIIDRNGGTLLTTPPSVKLIPVLRVNGTEVARGVISATLGAYQYRRLDFATASGYATTVRNYVTVGETYAVGIAYGRTSPQEIAASKERLNAARAAIPKDAQGNPDPNSPANMSEPVIGEMLHQSLMAYWNQNDIYAEMVARAQHVRWFHFLSAGYAIQDLVFQRIFNIPLDTLGGGFSFDIQANILGVRSLRGKSEDVRTWFKTIGMFGSSTEHSAFENLGRGSLSTMRLLSTALERGVPVYRIDATNRSTVLPLLKLSASVESNISQALNAGDVVIVHEDEITLGDWTGVGWIVMDPVSGGAGYLISGGLAGNVRTVNGGSFWDIMKTVSAYAWLAINLGLDLWGIWAGIALLLTPEPTLLTKVAGIALIVASLTALGFDVADLNGLLSGDISTQQYIGEQLSGLIIQAILKRVGIAAAGRIIDSIGPGAVSQVVRQLDTITQGVASKLLQRGFSEADIIRMTQRGLTTREAFQAMDDLAGRYGVGNARALLDNDYIAGKQAIERVARAALNAPVKPGLDRTVQNALSRNDFGYAYELERAAAQAGNVVEYGRRIDVEFTRITGFDANGNPVFATAREVQQLEGDIVLNNGAFIDAKHGPVGNTDLRIWNQIVKAQAAIDAGLIPEFRFEASSSVGQRMRAWAAANAPDVQFVINIGDGFPLFELAWLEEFVGEIGDNQAIYVPSQ